MEHDQVQAFLEHDRVTTGMGMQVREASPGHCVLAMTVREDMLNGFAITHGGMVFTLADSCFALACNHDPARPVVAQQAEVDFLRPTRAGDELVATASVRHQGRRAGIYDIDITCGGELVATFRGRCRELPPRREGAPATSTTHDPSSPESRGVRA